MATSPEAVRGELALVTAAVTQEILSVTSSVALEQQVDAALTAAGLIVPAYYDAAGALAIAWYDELRDEARPTVSYTPTIIGDPVTDWIEREIAKFQATIEADLEAEVARMVAETARLAEKEAARGFRDSILGNVRSDQEAVGWSRVARPGACKFCKMLADKGAVYRSKSTAIFAAHGNCNCATQPKFRNGDIGPEASTIQYVASAKRARDQRTQDRRNALVRAYLNENYPDSPG